jgi:hypothetical protein
MANQGALRVTAKRRDYVIANSSNAAGRHHCVLDQELDRCSIMKEQNSSIFDTIQMNSFSQHISLSLASVDTLRAVLTEDI